MKRELSLSPDVLKFSEELLQSRGLTFQSSKRLRESILHMSDWFIAHPRSQTPWKEEWAVDAYLAYYLPLNELRVRGTVKEGKAVGFFAGLDEVIDYGSGPGTASFALRNELPDLQNFRLIERSSKLMDLVKDRLPTNFQFEKDGNPQGNFSKTLFVASYSLTETELPTFALKAEALMIIEPSTHDDGRRLLELRTRLMNHGYHIWAPCPHQDACPLQVESKRDWCHDRVHVKRPDWLVHLESELPFRNQTVTCSYLLARRTPPPVPTWARLVGDQLEEKGKNRQLMCRGSKREFLTWMHKNGAPQELPRGSRIQVPKELTVTSNELRVTETIHVVPGFETV